MKLITLLLMGTLFTGCALHQSRDAAFYTLPTTTDAITPISNARMVIDVERVKVPEYIDRTQIVTTSGVGVNVDNDNRWAEGVPAMIQRKIITNIGAYMPHSVVKNGNFTSTSGGYSVFIEIYKMDGRLSDTATLDAIYSVAASGGATKTRNVHYTVPVGDNYDDYVVQIGKMIDKMSRDIAVSLEAMK